MQTLDKILFITATLLFCSVSYGQIYAGQKKNLTHIKCIETAVTTFKRNKLGTHQTNSEDELTSYFAFNEKFFFQRLAGYENFELVALITRDRGPWNIIYPPGPWEKELLINENVISFDTKYEPSDIEDDYKLSSVTESYTIDRITGKISRKIIRELEHINDDLLNLDITIDIKGTCSPYNPDQRAF